MQNTHQKVPQYPLRKRDPPWLEAVKIDPELIYRYQMSLKGIEDILEADLNSLKDVHQVINILNVQFDEVIVCIYFAADVS